MENSNKSGLTERLRAFYELPRIGEEQRLRIEDYKEKHSLLLNNSSFTVLMKEAGTIDLDNAVSIFFCNSDHMALNAEKINKDFPEERVDIEKICEDILLHKFDLLGTGKIPLGDKINWSKDYQSCYEWPNDVNYLEMGRSAFDILVGRYRDSEIKYPWDLSNLMWFTPLTSAYFLSGERKYIDAVERDLTDWFDNNPAGFGVSWFCPMNVAMRAINIIIAIASLAPYMNNDLVKRALEQLFYHGVLIMQNLEIEKAGKRNNHYMTNVVGMYYLGTLFGDTEFGRDWLSFAEIELEAEVRYQFLDDGVVFEDSTSYQRLTTEMVMLCAIQAKLNDREFSDGFYNRVHKAFNFMAEIATPHHNVPIVGDNDNGRMVQFTGFSERPAIDHRHLIAVGGEFFDDDALRRAGVGCEVEAVWYLGTYKKDLISFRDIGHHFAFKDGGFYGYKSEKSHLLIHNHVVNAYCCGGHAHEDALSLTFSYDNDDILIDPGCYRYSADIDSRNEFRSVENHNTVQVGKSRMHHFNRDTFEGLWWVYDMANAETYEADMSDGVFSFSGGIDSYIESDGYKVKRAIEFNEEEKSLDIKDSVISVEEERKSVPAFSRFLFAPGIEIRRVGYRKVELVKGDRVVAELETIEGDASFLIKDFWYAPEYGRKVAAKQLQICWHAEDEESIVNRLSVVVERLSLVGKNGLDGRNGHYGR
jgi:hypothetical protein